MNNFEYFEPESVAEACGLLEQSENAKALAGGVSLMVMLKNRLLTPDRIVNLKSIQGLSKIESDPTGGLLIGALCRHIDIQNSEIILERYGVLSEAASRIGNLPIRNMGTIGGNVCHSEPSADFPPALIALDAELIIAGTSGNRSVPVCEFFTDFYENVLEGGEVLTAIRLPHVSEGAGGAYECIRKSHNNITTVGAAAFIVLDREGKCARAGLGVGGVHSTPIEVKEVKSWIGGAIEPSLLEAAAEAASKQCDPISDVNASDKYRRSMVRVLCKRSLLRAWTKARDRVG